MASICDCLSRLVTPLSMTFCPRRVQSSAKRDPVCTTFRRAHKQHPSSSNHYILLLDSHSRTLIKSSQLPPRISATLKAKRAVLLNPPTPKPNCSRNDATTTTTITSTLDTQRRAPHSSCCVDFREKQLRNFIVVSSVSNSCESSPTSSLRATSHSAFPLIVIGDFAWDALPNTQHTIFRDQNLTSRPYRRHLPVDSTNTCSPSQKHTVVALSCPAIETFSHRRSHLIFSMTIQHLFVSRLSLS